MSDNSSTNNFSLGDKKIDFVGAEDNAHASIGEQKNKNTATSGDVSNTLGNIGNNTNTANGGQGGSVIGGFGEGGKGGTGGAGGKGGDATGGVGGSADVDLSNSGSNNTNLSNTGNGADLSNTGDNNADLSNGDNNASNDNSNSQVGSSKNKNKNDNTNVNEQAQSSASKSGVKGSGNSKQTQSASNQGVQNNTQVDARDQSTTKYEAAASTAYAAGIYGQSTAPCVKVSGIGAGAQTLGAGWTFNIRNDRESGNCITNQRVGMISQLYGNNDAAALYLAQQDPAMAATIAAVGLPSGRQVTVDNSVKKRNPLGQSTFAQPGVKVAPTQQVCRVKEGTTKTVVTNWADKKACARQLGLLR
jgi:hypothetical protein